MEFTTERIFESLQQPLTLVEEGRRDEFSRYVESARYPLERAVFDLLAAFAEDVDQQIAAHYHLALAYRPGAVEPRVEQRGPSTQQASDEAELLAGDGETEKITIRIPAPLKDLVTQAAAEAGVSVNTWIIRVLIGSLRSTMRGSEDEPHRHAHRERRGRGQRMSGWIGNE
jgi:hypothetical protein